MTMTEDLKKTAMRYAHDELKDNHASVEKIVAAAFLNGIDYNEHHPSWISVQDDLPKEDGRYLFCHTITGVQSAYYYKGLSLDKAVTHWMPLPAPPTSDKTSQVSGSSELPNNCKKFDIPGYENVIIHEGNAKGGEK